MANLALLDRAGETTATTGTGTVTLSGTRVSPYQTWSNAGAVNATQYPYLIMDGTDSEWGVGTYTSSGTTLSRDSVTGSIISGTSGTTKINLSGSAQVFCCGRAKDVGLVLLSEVSTTSSAASVTFSAIPATYRDLELRIRGRGTTSATSIDIRMQFNGDTGGNYDGQGMQGHNATAGAFPFAAATSIYLGNLAAATAPANAADLINVVISDYRGTTFQKAGITQATLKQAASTTGLYIEIDAFWWRNTAAITSVVVFPSAGGFVDNTIVSLYGRF